MKKIITVLCAAVMALSLFAGCGQKANDNGTTTGGTVSTDGSTSMEKVIGALGESFMEANSGTTFTYNPTGSGSGIQAVSEGRCDIGLSSRALKDDEKASGLKETIVALDGIAIIVNPQNPVKDLSLEQIAKIYTGEITNWKDVGGEDAEIVLIGREAGSGTRDGFESITETKDACQYRQELTSTGDVITTVSQNPNAIGYASLAAIKDSVKALTVNGVAPTEATVKDAHYKKMAYEQIKKLNKKPYPVTKSKAEDALEVAEKMKAKHPTLDFIFFDLPGTANNNDVICLVSKMNHIFTPIIADRVVLTSSIGYAKTINEAFITIGRGNVKSIHLVWNMVDGREKTELYDTYEKVFAEHALSVLKTFLPDSKRFRKETANERKAVFRSTVFPADKSLVRGSNLDKLVDEVLTIIKT